MRVRFLHDAPIFLTRAGRVQHCLVTFTENEMSGYLVRLIEVVGVYSSSSVGFLASMVDEVTDPSSCEYLFFGDGGFVWPKPGSPTLSRFDTPIDDADEFADFSWGTPEVDSLLGSALFYSKDCWKPLLPE